MQFEQGEDFFIGLTPAELTELRRKGEVADRNTGSRLSPDSATTVQFVPRLMEGEALLSDVDLTVKVPLVPGSWVAEVVVSHEGIKGDDTAVKNVFGETGRIIVGQVYSNHNEATGSR